MDGEGDLGIVHEWGRTAQRTSLDVFGLLGDPSGNGTQALPPLGTVEYLALVGTPARLGEGERILEGNET